MLSELLPEENKRLFDLEQQLIHLENGNKLIKSSDIYIGLEDMNKRLEYLEALSLQESKLRRDDYRRRIQHLKNSYHHLKNGLDNFIKSQYKNDLNRHKQELFAGSTIDIENDHYDIEIAENQSLSNSNKMINDYIKTGQETFHELLSQKERLKGIQRRVFDILNYLGISNTIMKTVEKRDVVDKWIVYFGMILITLLLLYIWWYWRR